MGDLIEMTTWPGDTNIFYRISSSGLRFEVKAASNAAIGLAKKPGNQCDVWVVIGQDMQGPRTWIKREEGNGKIVRTPNILNPREYRQFWLSWRNACIQLGRNSERIPFITYNHSADLSYITFSSFGRGGIPVERFTIHWRFILPPVLEKPKLKAVTGGELLWVQANNQLPDGALIGGYEGETLYIIRAPHRGSLTPGKFVPSEGTGYISWGGEAHEKNEFEVLCGYDSIWVPTVDDRIPVGAVEAGYSEGERETLYVGRALYHGHLIPGKVQPSHRVCYIPFNGEEVAHKKFEILVSPYTNMQSANRILIHHIDVESPPETDTEDDDGNVL